MMKRVWLISLVVAGLLFTIQNAGAMGVTTLELDREISLEAPGAPMTKATVPKRLLGYYYSDEPYIKVYRFRVEAGHKYTFYMLHPAKGISMNAYLRGDNPLTDYKYSYGPSGYLRNFVCHNQQPRKSSCEYQARRFNFTISPKSEHPWLYLIATYAKPNTSFKVLLKSQADRDKEVESSTRDAYCPERKGNYWGTVYEDDFLLTLIPGEKKVEEVAATGDRKISPPSSEQHDDIRTVVDWLAYIRSGRPFQVIFDATDKKFDDSVYSGDWGTDPMGTLKGGETYRLTYVNGKFECTGFNQGTNSVGTWAYIGDPEEGLISLWGRLFNFDGKGRVWDQDFGIVGHLSPS